MTDTPAPLAKAVREVMRLAFTYAQRHLERTITGDFTKEEAARAALEAAITRMAEVVEAAVAWDEAWSAPSRSQRAKEKARILGFAESRDRLRAAVWDYLEGSPPPATASQDETPLVDFALTQGRRRAAMEDEEAADG